MLRQHNKPDKAENLPRPARLRQLPIFNLQTSTPSSNIPPAMDPEYRSSDDEDAEAAAMAAAMGFSSFGSHQPATKKRKFNPATDAYIEGDELANLDKGGKKGQGSGGNTVPLGKERVFGSSSSSKAPGGGARLNPVEEGNQDEIALEESDDNDGEGPNYIDTSTAPPIESGDYVQRHVPTNSPPPTGVSEQEAREVQARIDALLASIGSGGGPEDGTQQQQPPQQPPPPGVPAGGAALNHTAFMLGGPRPPSSSRGGFNDGSSAASSSRPSGRGQRNPTWYIGYYDPSFNENPWAKLEQEKGLETLGRWPERQGVGISR